MDGRFRYSDLKEAAPGELWDLYMDEPVLIVCELLLRSSAWSFSRGIAREGVGRGWMGESESSDHTAL